MDGSVYAKARRKWDERYADLVLGKRNWQITAAGLLVLSLVLAFGLVRVSTRSRLISYVVRVDRLGYALAAPTIPAFWLLDLRIAFTGSTCPPGIYRARTFRPVLPLALGALLAVLPRDVGYGGRGRPLSSALPGNCDTSSNQQGFLISSVRRVSCHRRRR